MKTSQITVLSLYMYIHIVNQLIAATHIHVDKGHVVCSPPGLIGQLSNQLEIPLTFSTHSLQWPLCPYMVLLQVDANNNDHVITVLLLPVLHAILGTI